MLSLKIEPFPKFPICSFSIFPNGFIGILFIWTNSKILFEVGTSSKLVTFLNTLESATTASIVWLDGDCLLSFGFSKI